MANDLLSFLRDRNYDLQPVLDGKFHRFDRSGELTGWFTGQEISLPSGKRMAVARFGDWKTGEKFEYNGEGGDLSDAERDEIHARMQELARITAAEKAATQEAVAQASAKTWGNLQLPGPGFSLHGYLRAKGLKGFYGARVQAGVLLVPCKDITGKLWGMQRIWPDNSKKMTPGQRVRGCFHEIPPSKKDGPGADCKTVYFCEGFATGASIAEVTGARVIIAFSAGNLKAVCAEYAAANPECVPVVCADDDWKTVDARGLPTNPGVEAAHQAVRAMGRGLVCVPSFSRARSDKDTDFNDMVRLEGPFKALEVLKSAAAAALSGHAPANAPQDPGWGSLGEPVESPELSPTQPGPAGENPGPGAVVHELRAVGDGSGAGGRVTKKGSGDGAPPRAQKPKLPTEKEIAMALINSYGPRLLRQNKLLFEYRDAIWRLIDEMGEDAIKNRINRACGDGLGSRQVKSYFDTFVRYVPAVPEGVNLLNPNPGCVAFSNGTLHLRQSKDNFYSLSFEDHRLEDYCTNLIPMEYPKGVNPDNRKQNKKLHEVLDRLFDGEPDKAESIRAVRQMFGACLMPMFPHLFMLIGKPKTGKSTLIHLAKLLVAKENRCSVMPHEFKGFHMASMPGKLINADSDIDTTQPIVDSMVKKIIDREEIRVQVKNKDDRYALLPAVHIFGGNDMPKTLEGYQRAHDRRWTFLVFNHEQGTPGGGPSEDKQFWAQVWNESPEGLLTFALEGLEDLAASRGHYLNPSSGKARLEEWQEADDPVALFIRDLRDGEKIVASDGKSPVKLGPGLRIKREDLFVAFKNWSLVAESPAKNWSRNRVYDRIRLKGFGTWKTKYGRGFVGIGFEWQNNTAMEAGSGTETAPDNQSEEVEKLL